MQIKPIEFYAEVLIVSANRLGIVFGRVEADTGEWFYSVSDLNESEYCSHYDLIPTGRQFRREDFYDGKSVRVIVDASGNGTIKKPADESTGE